MKDYSGRNFIKLNSIASLGFMGAGTIAGSAASVMKSKRIKSISDLNLILS